MYEGTKELQTSLEVARELWSCEEVERQLQSCEEVDEALAHPSHPKCFCSSVSVLSGLALWPAWPVLAGLPGWEFPFGAAWVAIYLLLQILKRT